MSQSDQPRLSRTWKHLNKVVTRSGPFAHKDKELENKSVNELMKDFRVLVIGAGGLGCEMLKNLAMSGFINIHVVDCDTIELSNLNRQFLFRSKDIGRSKAEVAAEFINSRVSGCQIVPHFKKIEDLSMSFYRTFNTIVCGLDAIEPRLWLNSTLHQMLSVDRNGYLLHSVPLVDGGTEGFKGNARIIFPGCGEGPCIECMIDLYPPKVSYPLCTLTQRPRLPEHCIEYAKIVQWPRDKPFGEQQPLDGDDPTHITWIYERASERASEFGIEGVTYRLTQGVVKNIIPAVASTNAVIAAACCTEVFKLATDANPYLNNFIVFNDSDGIYTYKYQAEKNTNCRTCNIPPSKQISASPHITLKQFIETSLKSYGINEINSLQVQRQQATVPLFLKGMESIYETNLSKTFQELEIEHDHQLLVMDEQWSCRIFSVDFPNNHDDLN